MSVDLHPAIVASHLPNGPVSGPATGAATGPVTGLADAPSPADAPAGAAAAVALHWPDEAACQAFAEGLAARLRALPPPLSVTVALHGPLGAGKTTFVRHLLRALGVQGRIKSPSYAVLEPHEAPAQPPHGPLAIAHLDFYRFDDPLEWADAGLREVFAAPGLRLVEWPDRAAGLPGPPDLRLDIEPLDASGRAVRVQAVGRVGTWLLGGA